MESTDRFGFDTLKIFAKANNFNRWLYDSVSPYCRGEVLEVGSGIGNISKYFYGSVLSITVSDSRVEYCKILREKYQNSDRAIKILQLDISAENFDQVYSILLDTFDTVILLNVLEHIENRNLALKNCKKLLRKNGRLVILVPAFHKLYNNLDRNLGHFMRYSKPNLRKLLELEGFEIYRIKYFNSPAILGWWFVGSILKRSHISLKQLQTFNFFLPFFRVMDSLLKPFLGISIIAVAESR